MPWNEVNLKSPRREFIHLATQENVNLSELCRRFGLSRKTAYKWLQRFREHGDDGLRDRPRQPRKASKNRNNTATPWRWYSVS